MQIKTGLRKLNPIVWFYRLEPIEKFTAVLCVVGALQLWAFVQSERAFVVPTETHFAKWPLVPGHKPLELIVEFKNIGRSTATFAELTVAISDGLPEKPKFSEGYKVTIAPLAAGGGQTVHSYFGDGIGPQFISDLEIGKKKIYFWGRALYWDEFSLGLFGPKETIFCYAFYPERDSPRMFDTCHEPQYTYAN